MRIDGPGRVHINLKLKGGLYLSTIPGKMVDDLLPRVRDVYPAMEAARNCMMTILQNGNPTIHPAVSLCNAARIDNTAGDFFFFVNESNRLRERRNANATISQPTLTIEGKRR